MSRFENTALQRRQWLQWTAALAASASLAALRAQLGQTGSRTDFLQGSKHVTLEVVGPAGGATDGVARVLAQAFSTQLGREVIVENKAGAGGTIGSKHVSVAKNDGHTLLLGHIGTNALSQ